MDPGIEAISDGQTQKRFRIKSGLHGSLLPHIVRLGMFRDAILSSVRWYNRLRDDESPEASTDRLFSILTGAGWTPQKRDYSYRPIQ